MVLQCIKPRIPTTIFFVFTNMTTPRNKRPDLKIDGGDMDGMPPPIVAHTSPFVDLSEAPPAPNNKAAGGYTSNTSSSSSDDDDDDDAPRVERRVSFRNKNQVVLTGSKIDLSGVDSTPFTPSSKAKAEAVSPFLDEADLAKAATTTKSTATKRTMPLKIDLSKKRMEQQPVVPAQMTTATADEFAVERRELQARARRAERRLAFALMESALRRRKNALLRLFLRRWRLATSMHITPFPQKEARAVDDAQVLADQLLKRLKELRGE